MGGCREEAGTVAIIQYEVSKDLKNEMVNKYCRNCEQIYCDSDCELWGVLEIIDKHLEYSYDCQWK